MRWTATRHAATYLVAHATSARRPCSRSHLTGAGALGYGVLDGSVVAICLGMGLAGLPMIMDLDGGAPKPVRAKDPVRAVEPAESWLERRARRERFRARWPEMAKRLDAYDPIPACMHEHTEPIETGSWEYVGSRCVQCHEQTEDVPGLERGVYSPRLALEAKCAAMERLTAGFKIEGDVVVVSDRERRQYQALLHEAECIKAIIEHQEAAASISRVPPAQMARR